MVPIFAWCRYREPHPRGTRAERQGYRAPPSVPRCATTAPLRSADNPPSVRLPRPSRRIAAACGPRVRESGTTPAARGTEAVDQAADDSFARLRLLGSALPQVARLKLGADHRAERRRLPVTSIFQRTVASSRFAKSRDCITDIDGLPDSGRTSRSSQTPAARLRLHGIRTDLTCIPPETLREFGRVVLGVRLHHVSSMVAFRGQRPDEVHRMEFSGGTGALCAESDGRGPAVAPEKSVRARVGPPEDRATVPVPRCGSCLPL